jgi:hypothetical protein
MAILSWGISLKSAKIYILLLLSIVTLSFKQLKQLKIMIQFEFHAWFKLVYSFCGQSGGAGYLALIEFIIITSVG